MAEETDKVGISDDIGQEIESKQRQQLEDELVSHEEKLDDVIKLKDRHRLQLERDRRIYEIRLEGDNFKRIEPVFKHETLDEYWNLIRDVLQDEFEENMARGEGRQRQFDQEIEYLTKEVERIKQDLADLEA